MSVATIIMKTMPNMYFKRATPGLVALKNYMQMVLYKYFKHIQ